VSRVICVTEGIETGLAVQEHTGITTLSAISAGNLERFEPPRGVRFVEIWADNDISGTGQRSSARAERSLSSLGYIVSVKMSPVIGADWLDVLCG
jgi:putative DNA primase/helicase